MKYCCSHVLLTKCKTNGSTQFCQTWATQISGGISTFASFLVGAKVQAWRCIRGFLLRKLILFTSFCEIRLEREGMFFPCDKQTNIIENEFLYVLM
jgi:hypothetical protein